MVLQRNALRTYALAYLRNDEASAQRRTIERYVTLHGIKVLRWYEDKHTQYKQQKHMLEALTRSIDPIDYVLVHDAFALGKTQSRVRSVSRHCMLCGAQVIYTSRA